jgi:hypothetical protein
MVAGIRDRNVTMGQTHGRGDEGQRVRSVLRGPDAQASGRQGPCDGNLTAAAGVPVRAFGAARGQQQHG